MKSQNKQQKQQSRLDCAELAYLRIGSSSGFAFHPGSFASEMSGMVLGRSETVGRFKGWILVFRQLQLLALGGTLHKSREVQRSALDHLKDFRGSDSPEDVVHTHNTVRSGGATVVHDGGVALHPHPSSVL